MSGFKLTPQSARRFKQMMNAGKSSQRAELRGGGTSRYDCHVRITGPEDEDTGMYPCVPSYYDTEAGSWVEFEECRAKGSNGKQLINDERYRAIHYGEVVEGSDEYLFFAVDERIPFEDGCGIILSEIEDENGNISYLLEVDAEKLGGTHLTTETDDNGTSSSGDDCTVLRVTPETLVKCNLKYVEADAETEEPDGIAVDVDSLAGKGLEVQEGEDGECPALTIKPICGQIEVTEDGIGLVLEAIFDTKGFEIIEPDSGETCSRISLKPICGQVEITEDGIGIVPEAIIGPGLEVIEPGSGETCSTIGVLPRCGNIDVTPDGIAVVPEALAGPGLDVQPPGSGEECSTLKVAVDDCTTEIVAGKVVVKLEGIAGKGLEVDDSGECPQLSIKPLCGNIQVTPDGVGVVPEVLAGPGLDVQPPGSGEECGTLRVAVDNCTTEIVSGKVTVKLEGIAGPGLDVDDSGECPQLSIKPLCGNIQVTPDGIGVVPEALVGPGLDVQAPGSGEECGTLKVAVDDCTTEIVAGKVAVKLTGIAGKGLEVDDSGSCPQLSIKPMCGNIDVTPDGVGVVPEALVGPGLTTEPPGPGETCSTLKVAVDDCTTEIVSGKVTVKLTGIAGKGLEVDDSGSCPQLTIKPGCGNIDVTLDGVSVNVDALRGTGLVVTPPGPGESCGTLAVDTTVHSTTLVGYVAGEAPWYCYTENCVTKCVQTWYPQYMQKTAAGLLVGLYLGEAIEEEFTVENIKANCGCCSSSSSSSGQSSSTNPPSSSSSSTAPSSSSNPPVSSSSSQSSPAPSSSSSSSSNTSSSSSAGLPCGCLESTCFTVQMPSGLADTGLDGACRCTPYLGNVYHLVFIGSCTWASTATGWCYSSGYHAVVSYSGGTWTLAMIGGPNYTFSGSLNCSGANVFSRVGGADTVFCTNWPSTITVIGGACGSSSSSTASSSSSFFFPMAIAPTARDFAQWDVTEQFAYQAMLETPALAPTFPEKSVVISLPRRLDRRRQVQEQFGKAGVKYEIVDAVDGEQCVVPDTWVAPKPAWGCRLSHLAALDDALLKGLKCIAVYEDDVVLTDGYLLNLNDTIREVTAVDPDWQAIMIGGQHATRPPVETSNPNILRCQDCRRTHAYIVRGEEYIRTLRDTFRDDVTEHIDHAWGRRQPGDRVYCPRQFLAFQGAGKSDITGKVRGQRSWQPKKITPRPVEQRPKECGKCRKKGAE